MAPTPRNRPAPIAVLAPRASDSYTAAHRKLVRVYVPRQLFMSRVTEWLQLLEELHAKLRQEKTLRRMQLEMYEVPQDRLSVQFKDHQLDLTSGKPIAERIRRVVRAVQEREAFAFYQRSPEEQTVMRRTYRAELDAM
jgi:hypothetical protein